MCAVCCGFPSHAPFPKTPLSIPKPPPQNPKKLTRRKVLVEGFDGDVRALDAHPRLPLFATGTSAGTLQVIRVFIGIAQIIRVIRSTRTRACRCALLAPAPARCRCVPCCKAAFARLAPACSLPAPARTLQG
jgi:hypothetical protein